LSAHLPELWCRESSLRILCRMSQSGSRQPCARFPPPNGIILSNLANQLIADPEFYREVASLAFERGLSAIFHQKVVVVASNSQGRFQWIYDRDFPENDISDDGGDSKAAEPQYRDNFLKKACQGIEKVKANAITTKAADLERRIKVVLTTTDLPQNQLLQNSKEEEASGAEAEKTPRLEIDRVLTEKDLDFRRLKASDFDCFPVFKGYKAGKASHKLYVKNISRKVTKAEVINIYEGFVPERQKGSFREVRYFTSGKLRGQAFVTLPDKRIATRARRLTNGFMVKGKPLVVVFGSSVVASAK